MTQPEYRTFDDVIRAVAAEHGLRPEQLTGPSRVPRIVTARYDGFARARDVLAASLMSIAAAFNRDHTTVIHGLRKHRACATRS